MNFDSFVRQYNYRYDSNILFFQRGPLSNWHGSFGDQESPIVFDIEISHMDMEKFEFNCSEQLVMALKAELFHDWETLNLILNEKSAKMQKELGRQVRGFDSTVWDKNKREIYKTAVYEKFRQNKDIRDMLLLIPRQAIICEAAPWDNVWGNGLSMNDPLATDLRKWPGKNLLGEILMDVRKYMEDNLPSIEGNYDPVIS